jgi:hypothetical protein
MTRETQIKHRLRKARFDYRHPVFYSRKPPAASHLDDEVAYALHQHLKIVE